MISCPHCAAQLPNLKAKFCPRCGQTLPQGPVVPADQPVASTEPFQAPPIRLEPRGNLVNPFFIGSVILVILGAVLAGEGEGFFVIGLVMLIIGLPSVLIATVRSLVR